jgi:hypothetical protein
MSDADCADDDDDAVVGLVGPGGSVRLGTACYRIEDR